MAESKGPTTFPGFQKVGDPFRLQRGRHRTASESDDLYRRDEHRPCVWLPVTADFLTVV